MSTRLTARVLFGTAACFGMMTLTCTAGPLPPPAHNAPQRIFTNDKRETMPYRVYVIGQSMGGYGAWDIIQRRPELFAAAIPTCGAGDPSRAAVLKDLPVWIFHGSNDRSVPVSGSRQMETALKKVGGNVRYTEYAGLGHCSWPRAYAEPGLVEWLFSQKRADVTDNKSTEPDTREPGRNP